MPYLLPSRLPTAPGPRYSAALLLTLPLMGQAIPPQPFPAPRTAPAAEARVPASRPAAAPSTVAVRRAAPEQEGPYRLTPERRALLNTIRYAEGTWIGGSREGYRVLYGGGRFEGLERHPEITVRRRYASAAAGAYQFLPNTWKDAASKLKLPDFGPGSQDQAALYLVEKRGALSVFDRNGLNTEVLHRLAPEWASLPTRYGTSHYGQPVKGAQELRRFYLSDLGRQRRAGAGSPT